MEVKSFFDQVFFTTVRVECEGSVERWVGTAFIYAVETTQGPAHFLVSNKHVFQGASILTSQMVQGTDGKPQLGVAAHAVITDFDADIWSGHPDSNVDVAAMPLWGLLHLMEKRGISPYFRAIPENLALTPESTEELDSVIDVAFVGYPNGLFDTVNLLPIVRRGTTATPVMVDYEGAPAFLVDASVFPGSSGSPVFLIENGVRYDRNDGWTMGSVRQSFLGVIASVHVTHLKGVIKKIPAAYAVSIKEPIDLGIVYKASTITPCIDPILTRYGLVRANRDVSNPGEISAADIQMSG